MLVLLFYSIISDSWTFKDKYELTQRDVLNAINENNIIITDIIIENITVIGESAFYYCYNTVKSISISVLS